MSPKSASVMPKASGPRKVSRECARSAGLVWVRGCVGVGRVGEGREGRCDLSAVARSIDGFGGGSAYVEDFCADRCSRAARVIEPMALGLPAVQLVPLGRPEIGLSPSAFPA
jgi:hypothetical protein